MTGAFPSKKIGATSLMYACQQGKETQVINIVNTKPGAVLERERTLKTALHYCAESGDGGVSSAAVLLGAAPELVLAQDQDGYSALHLAVIAGNVALAKLLLSHGAPVNMPDNEGHTPAHWATVCGEIDCLEVLLAKGGDPNIGDMHGGCPLHYAAQMCGPFSDMPADRRLGMAALRILLDNSADANLPDNHGRQPILWAASAGSSEAILVLVGAGANVAAADKDGLTALHCAASRGHTDCVETLINLCSAEPDVIDNNGCSALFYAVTLGHADATQTLLNHGANTNRQDRKGRTAVHCGAAKGQLETLKVVAAWGGNLWQKTVRGDYPLHDAVSSGRRPLVIWLLTQRPDSVNSPNNDGRCPLHIAALQNNIEMCKTLLDAGSLVNPVMRTAKGALATPLDAALHKGHRGCAKYLQLHGGVPASRLNSESAALRGLSTSREISKTGPQKISKNELEDKLLAVDEPKVEFKVEPKHVTIEPPTEDQFPTMEKDRPIVSPRPHILQVYVEDDLMIRRLRHHEGSDSSIEERVRRRRRKRKSKMMSDRERSAHSQSGRRLSSSDEITDSRPRSQSREKSADKESMVEKVVQTEFSVQPDSLQSQFESMLMNERIHESDSVLAVGDGKSKEASSVRVPQGPIPDLSSGDSDKKSTVHIVEAQVHHENKSIESEELKLSVEEQTRESSREEDDSTKQESVAKVEDSKNMIHESSQQNSTPQTEQHQPSEFTEHTATDKTTTNASESTPQTKGTNDIAKLNDNKSPTSALKHADEPVAPSEVKSNDANGLSPAKPKDEATNRSSDKQENLKADSLGVEDESYNSLTNGIAANGRDTSQNGSAGVKRQVSSQGSLLAAVNAASDGTVPNDRLVAEVLLQNIHEDEQLSRDQSHLENKVVGDGTPQTGQIDGETTAELDQLKNGNHIPTAHPASRQPSEIGNLPPTPLDDKLKYEGNKGSSANEVKAEQVQATYDEKDMTAHGQLAENTEVAAAEMSPKHKMSEDQLPVDVTVDDGGGSGDKIDVLGNFSKDSFDIEGSLDELPLNITKDSDEAPPELDLPDPIIDEEWEGKTEVERVATEILMANGDRGLVKVIGDPTGGDPNYVSDKRRKLRRKREGNKKWMNSRSTESFEVLKLPEEKTDEEGLTDTEKPLDDVEAKSGKKDTPRRSSAKDRSRINRPCRRSHESDVETTLSTVSVTQAVQYSVRKYHLERRIFYQLLELKRLQIRAGRASEAVLVKRLVDEYKKAGLMLGLQQYDGVYTFRSFEKFLYEQLRLLQTSERRIIPRLRSTDDLERLTAALRKTRVGQEILASVPNNPALCTHQTHRCHHATHAYTGIPCAAYIARPNHHTMPKPVPYTGFLPKLVNDENQGEVAKTLRHVDPSRPLTLELSHGPDKQVITLPTEKLDKSKKYFVTFTIKSSNHKKNELKHSHATSI